MVAGTCLLAAAAGMDLVDSPLVVPYQRPLVECQTVDQMMPLAERAAAEIAIAVDLLERSLDPWKYLALVR